MKKSLNDFICKITKQVSDISISILDDKLSAADKRIKELDASQEKLMKKIDYSIDRVIEHKKDFYLFEGPKSFVFWSSQLSIIILMFLNMYSFFNR